MTGTFQQQFRTPLKWRLLSTPWSNEHAPQVWEAAAATAPCGSSTAAGERTSSLPATELRGAVSAVSATNGDAVGSARAPGASFASISPQPTPTPAPSIIRNDN